MNPKPDNIPTTYSELLEFLKEASDDLGLSQDIKDKINSFPLEQDEISEEKSREIIQEIATIINLIVSTSQVKQKKISDHAREIVNMYESLIVRKKYKTSEQSEYRQKRNQEIVDKAYESGRGDMEFYEEVAEDYPELGAAGVKKVIFSHDAPTPTKLQKKKQ